MLSQQSNLNQLLESVRYEARSHFNWVREFMWDLDYCPCCKKVPVKGSSYSLTYYVDAEFDLLACYWFCSDCSLKTRSEENSVRRSVIMNGQKAT